jgi:hypothetical protein
MISRTSCPCLTMSTYILLPVRSISGNLLSITDSPRSSLTSLQATRHGHVQCCSWLVWIICWRTRYQLLLAKQRVAWTCMRVELLQVGCCSQPRTPSRTGCPAEYALVKLLDHQLVLEHFGTEEALVGVWHGAGTDGDGAQGWAAGTWLQVQPRSTDGPHVSALEVRASDSVRSHDSQSQKICGWVG